MQGDVEWFGSVQGESYLLIKSDARLQMARLKGKACAAGMGCFPACDGYSRIIVRTTRRRSPGLLNDRQPVSIACKGEFRRERAYRRNPGGLLIVSRRPGVAAGGGAGNQTAQTAGGLAIWRRNTMRNSASLCSKRHHFLITLCQVSDYSITVRRKQAVCRSFYAAAWNNREISTEYRSNSASSA